MGLTVNQYANATMVEVATASLASVSAHLVGLGPLAGIRKDELRLCTNGKNSSSWFFTHKVYEAS